MTAAPARTASAAPLALSMALGGEDLERVNALILGRVSAEVPLIQDIARHIIASGGKRLRPLMTILSARLCGYKDGARHIGLAAAVELIHTATLLHDDVVDESHLRRGMATANDVFGNKASVLVGDFLLTQAFQLMVADGSFATLKVLSDAAAVISKGEVKQLMAEGDPETTREAYLDVISCKTAAMFAAACELGAIMGGKDAWEERLRGFGQAIGIAFQLVDDALDYSADQRTLGKTVGDDFREGKITLPALHCYAAANPEERAFWQRAMGGREQQEGDLEHALVLMEKYSAISATFAEARAYADEAAAAIAPLPDCPEKQALLEIVDFCVERMY